MRKNSFLGGAGILTLSALIVKGFGFLFKIPLLRILGGEGMGLFSSAYELYVLFFVLSTAGIPAAVSILMSGFVARGEYAAAEKTARVALVSLTLLGLFLTAILALLSRPFSSLLGNEKLAPSVLAISPALLFTSVSGALRGYFQGYKDMKPTAVSQIVEGFGKLLFGLGAPLAARRLLPDPVDLAPFAVLGLVAGTFFSVVYLLRKRARYAGVFGKMSLKEAPEASVIFKKLGRLALPISLGACLPVIAGAADMAMIQRGLIACGYAPAVATALYGGYAALAIPLCNLVPSLLNGIGVSLIPTLSASLGAGKRERAEEDFFSAFSLCLCAALPAAAGLCLFSEPVLSLLAVGNENAVRSVCLPLSILALSVLPSSLMNLLSSALQVYGKPTAPLVSMGIGLCFKCFLSFVLIRNPSVGLLGAPLGTVVSATVTVCMELWFLSGVGGFKPFAGKLIRKPMLSLMPSFGAAVGVFLIGRGNNTATIAAIAVCALCYGILLVVSRALPDMGILKKNTKH